MEYLKCNQLSCRAPLRETAVVTTCSHCFCVTCANNLFGNTQICPACTATLTEPDDIVICSLQPTNDYKTSVLSGLSPAIILQICERAMSFWEYQCRQESAFQQAVLKNVNDKSAHIQKQLENVIREANGEIGLLTSKIQGMEREYEIEKRKNREQLEYLKEKDKEYSKLKNQFDQLKRRALLAPLSATSATNIQSHFGNVESNPLVEDHVRSRTVGNDMSNGMRTPLRPSNQNSGVVWQTTSVSRNAAKRFQAPQTLSSSEQGVGTRQRRHGSDGNNSDSTNEVEALLGVGNAPPSLQESGSAYMMHPRENMYASRSVPATGTLRVQRTFSFGAPTKQDQRRSGTFRPAGFNRG